MSLHDSDTKINVRRDSTFNANGTQQDDRLGSSNAVEE